MIVNQVFREVLKNNCLQLSIPDFKAGSRELISYMSDVGPMVKQAEQTQKIASQSDVDLSLSAPNFDVEAFKIKSAYTKSFAETGDKETAKKSALAKNQYLVWKPLIQPFVKIPNNLRRIPSRPEKLSGTDKFSRAFGKRSTDEKEAALLKKQARKGQVNEDLRDRVLSRVRTDRRSKKAAFEYQFFEASRWLASLNERFHSSLQWTTPELKPLQRVYVEKVDLANTYTEWITSWTTVLGDGSKDGAKKRVLNDGLNTLKTDIQSLA